MCIKLANLLCLVVGIQIQVNASLIAWWKMDEANWNGTTGEVIDSSANLIHGKAVNGADTTQGFFDRCGYFNDYSMYVEMYKVKMF